MCFTDGCLTCLLYTSDYKGFRVIIPIKEMMINLGRSPSGQEYADLMLRQNKILGNMLGADIDFIVRGIDSKTRSVVASRKEAMLRKRQIFYLDTDAAGMYRVYEGRIVQALSLIHIWRSFWATMQPGNRAAAFPAMVLHRWPLRPTSFSAFPLCSDRLMACMAS